MSTIHRKVMLTAKIAGIAAAALVAASTLSGCDALYSQLHQSVPHDHNHDGHDH